VESGTSGGPSGDLYVVIHVSEHEQFERQGANLYSSVLITSRGCFGSRASAVATLDSQQIARCQSVRKRGQSFV
jgi:molecular chaperone DnaJ